MPGRRLNSRIRNRVNVELAVYHNLPVIMISEKFVSFRVSSFSRSRDNGTLIRLQIVNDYVAFVKVPGNTSSTMHKATRLAYLIRSRIPRIAFLEP